MNRQTGHHGCKTAPLLCLVIAVTLGLVSSRQAAAAKECHRETPLPPDVRLIAPDPEVPEALARFAGVWNGASERPATWRPAVPYAGGRSGGGQRRCSGPLQL